MRRSVSTDIELDAGTYSVLMKITAKRWFDKPTPEQVIRDSCRQRQDKLIQIGLAYDLAHAKGHVKETEREKELRKEREEKKKAAEKIKRRKEFHDQKFKDWQIRVKQKARDKRHAERRAERRRKKTEAAEVAEAAHPENDAPADAPAGDGTGDTDQEPVPATGFEPEDPQSEAEAEDEAETPTSPLPPADVQPTEPTKLSGLESTEVEYEYVTTKKLSRKLQNEPQAVPSALVNGESIDPGPPSTIVPSTADPLPLESDYDSDESFNPSIDSDLDFAPSTIIVAVDAATAEDTDDDEAEDEDAEFANDPWNAVCVVGLRVYSKDPGACVQVVRPKEEEDGESPLDVDDISKGASGKKVEEQGEIGKC